jgi:hypothetical protein
MMTQMTYPIPIQTYTTGMPNNVFEMWPRVTGLYRDAMEASAQQLLLSSSRIIQEQTLRAFVAASQACAEALAKNAVVVHQQSLARLADANQKAAVMIGRAVVDVWMVGLKPVR